MVSIVKTTQIKKTITWKGKMTDDENNITAVMTAKFSNAYPEGLFILENRTDDESIEEEYEQFKSDFLTYIEDMEPLVTESEAADD